MLQLRYHQCPATNAIAIAVSGPGEDPYLSGQYAVAFVQGMERNPDDPGHIQASACCKHYAANSMEHTTEGGQTHTRHDFDANITQQDLIDSYLAPFQQCVERGKVSGLMCSCKTYPPASTHARPRSGGPRAPRVRRPGLGWWCVAC